MFYCESEANIPPFNDKSKIITRNPLPSSQVDPQKTFASKTTKDGCWRNYNMKRPWISCMFDSSLNIVLKLHHVPRCKRIQLSFSWNQHPVSTEKIWWTPIGIFVCPLTKVDECPLANLLMMITHWMMTLKTTHCFFFYVWNCSLLTLLSIAHWRICWFSLTNENDHWLLCWCCRDFQFDNHCKFHWHLPPLSAKRRDNLLQITSEVPPRCRSVSLVYSPVQLHESTIAIFTVGFNMCEWIRL